MSTVKGNTDPLNLYNENKKGEKCNFKVLLKEDDTTKDWNNKVESNNIDSTENSIKEETNLKGGM